MLADQAQKVATVAVSPVEHRRHTELAIH
jgi:hypothetical protein